MIDAEKVSFKELYLLICWKPWDKEVRKMHAEI